MWVKRKSYFLLEPVVIKVDLPLQELEHWLSIQVDSLRRNTSFWRLTHRVDYQPIRVGCIVDRYFKLPGLLRLTHPPRALVQDKEIIHLIATRYELPNQKQRGKQR